MRVIFLNRSFRPATTATAQLLTDLASALAEGGTDVVVIASGRPAGAGDACGRLRVRRAGGGSTGADSLLGKAIAWAAFSLTASWALLREAKPGDIIVAMTDPPLLGIVAGWIARLKSARIIHWVQDIYPEIAMELTSQRWLRLALPLRNSAWRHADHVVTLGEDMAGVVAGAGVAVERISVIPNWAPAGLEPYEPDADAVRDQRRTWGVNDRFVVGYSGNLGRVHDLDPVLDAASLLRGMESIVFLFVGGGAQKARLQSEAARRRLTNVRFAGAQPRERLGPALAAADVHLVTLKPGCERYVYPSKLYGIAAVGRPVVFVGPPECGLARLVTDSGLGRQVDREHPAALAATLHELAGNPRALAAHRAASAAFGRGSRIQAAAAAWKATLDKVKACG